MAAESSLTTRSNSMPETNPPTVPNESLTLVTSQYIGKIRTILL